MDNWTLTIEIIARSLWWIIPILGYVIGIGIIER